MIMARLRKWYSIRDDVPTDQEAWRLWEENGFKSEYITECILRCKEMDNQAAGSFSKEDLCMELDRFKARLIKDLMDAMKKDKSAELIKAEDQDEQKDKVPEKLMIFMDNLRKK